MPRLRDQLEAVFSQAQPQMTLRPFQPGEFVRNADGSQSTERTVSVPLGDGSWINAPSLWMTEDGSPADFGMDEEAIRDIALKFEQSSGVQFPRFRSVDEAVAAAKARSTSGGVFSGPLAQ